ncbi:type III secretion system gatekeeper subunit SctW [Desulfovibrionales bacterium]
MAVDFSINPNFTQQVHSERSGSGSGPLVGSLMGREAVAVDSPMSLLADAAEELTFAVDTTEQYELADRKERKSTEDSLIERVRMYQELMHQAGKTHDMDQLTQRMRMVETRERALREAREYFPDSSDAWAALKASLEQLEAEGAPETAVTSVREAIAELEQTEGAAIRAGIYGATAAQEFSGLDTTDGLRDLYRQAVLDFGTVNDVFAHVQERFGDVGFGQAMDFLFRALGNDLGSDAPSMDATHLEHVHSNLGQVRLLQSAHTLCDTMLQRWESVHGIKGVRDDSLTSMDLLGEIVGLRNERFLGAMNIESIASRAKAPDIEREVLFLQELLNTTRSFPSQLFDGDQGRMKVLDAVQEAVDNAIAREDAFLAAQEEG